MTTIMDNPGTRVILSFLLSLLVIYVFARMVGEENKAKWFKKRTKYTVFTRRGFLGDTLHFGHPVTKQGYYVMLAMFSVIVVLSYVIVFLL